MIFINTLYARTRRLRCVVESNMQLFRFDRVTRRRVICEQQSHTRIFMNQRTIDSFMQTVDERLPVAKIVKELERAIRWLGNAMQREQSKAAMKRF